MRLTAFRHVAGDELGYLGEALAAREAEWQYVDAWEQCIAPSPAPSLAPVDGLILLGGPMSVNEALPWLRTELEVLERALRERIPVLGLCLGAQLLARVLGARVAPCVRPEIGWHALSFSAAAQSDPLLRGATDGPVFQWHYEGFEHPRGAERLAFSAVCPNQAFRYESAWGLQFHLEATPAIIGSWLEQDARCGEGREARHDIDPYAHQARARELAMTVFHRWLDIVALRQERAA